MGIGRQQGRAALAAIRAGTNRNDVREQVGDAIALLQRWANDWDMQRAGALQGFADSRPTQYDNFLDSLTEPVADPTP